MNKPFKGFISQWVLTQNRIYGTHISADFDHKTPIKTSSVVCITVESGARIVETKNSRYILL